MNTVSGIFCVDWSICRETHSIHKPHTTRAQTEIAKVCPNSTLKFMEPHLTISDVATMWKLSEDTVRRMFQDEPGVLVLGGRSGGGKRRYTTLRIPQSVVERVHRKYELGY